MKVMSFFGQNENDNKIAVNESVYVSFTLPGSLKNCWPCELYLLLAKCKIHKPGIYSLSQNF